MAAWADFLKKQRKLPGNITNGDVNVVVSEELRCSSIHGPVH
jgi:hypothetical protein